MTESKIFATPSVQVRYARELLNQVSIEEGIAALAEAFHVLRGAPGLRPWNPGAFLAWAIDPRRPASVQHAARFLLCLGCKDEFKRLESRSGARLGSFDVLEAMAAWDDQNRAAFLAWAEDPWWP